MGSVDIYPPSQPSGMTLAYAEAATNQGAITTEVDLTGLTVTVTVPAGRRIRLIAKANFQSTIADDRAGLRIYEGATLLNEGTQTVRTVNLDETIVTEAIILPTAGTHTYKLRGLRVSGTGTLTLTCGATFPAHILAEDITGTIYPAGTLVTSGIIASEAYTTWTPSVVQSVSVTSTVVTARYFRFGRMINVYGRVNITGSGTSGQAVTMTVPVPAFAHGGNGIPIGSGWIYDSSAVRMYAGSWNILGTGLTVDFVTDETGGNDWGVVPAIGLANADQLSFQYTYEAAT